MDIAKNIKPFVPLQAVKAIVRGAASNARLRGVLNALYRKMPTSQRSRCHGHLARIFRDRNNTAIRPGHWHVDFAGKAMVLPLKPETLWLDWDLALAVDGHDTEIKETYAAILQSSAKPAVFVDVGANYGTHSLIFLIHGVQTITIEPNPSCHSYFIEACKMNGVEPWLERVAVGDARTPLNLRFPTGETWLGSVLPEFIGGQYEVTTLEVHQRLLDDVLEHVCEGPLLLKLDAEGFESQVLAGARREIDRRRPLIVFEANESRQRETLYTVFKSMGYNISELPWLAKSEPLAVSKKGMYVSCKHAQLSRENLLKTAHL